MEGLTWSSHSYIINNYSNYITSFIINLTTQPSKRGKFKYGNCALVGIATAFDIPYNRVKVWYRSIGITELSGCNYQDCYKGISHFAKLVGKRVKYTKIKRKKRYLLSTFQTVYKKGTYIVSCTCHVSVVIDGIVYDSFLCRNGSRVTTDVTGYWKIY